MKLKIYKMRDLEFYPDNKLQKFNISNAFYQCIENINGCKLHNLDLNKLMIFKR